jgi:hypothetical protein
MAQARHGHWREGSGVSGHYQAISESNARCPTEPYLRFCSRPKVGGRHELLAILSGQRAMVFGQLIFRRFI